MGRPRKHARVGVEKVALEIINAINDYTEEVREAAQEALDRNAKEMLRELKSTAPKDQGDYMKSFRLKKVNKHRLVTRLVHNKDHYRLTHLLEKGHAKVNGGRTKAIPHFKPVEKKYVKKLEDEVEEIIKNGGAL